MSKPRCLYYGCWNTAGHYMHLPDGRWPSTRELEYYGDHVHLDGALAPRRMLRGRSTATGELCWKGQGRTLDERQRIGYDSDEFPQGQFLLHFLSTGYTAIQWWDRCQGDRRGGCNSTILLEGERTAAEMLAALHEHFPHVAANLARVGAALVEIKP